MQQQTGPILLATDLSACSDRALDRALQLAEQHQTKLIVVHIMTPNGSPGLTTPVWCRLTPDHKVLAERRLADDLADCKVPTEVLIMTGDPVKYITEAAQTHNCSLIVTDIARDETLDRLLLGNTVKKLARKVQQPILVVKSRPRHAYRNVLVATDFSNGSRQAITAGLNVAGDAALTLFHGYNVPFQGKNTPDDAVSRSFHNAAEENVKEFIANTPDLCERPAPTLVLQAGQPKTLLSEYVFNERSELVVTGTHSLTGILRTAIGSVAERLLEALPCDVLIVRQIEGK